MNKLMTLIMVSLMIFTLSLTGCASKESIEATPAPVIEPEEITDSVPEPEPEPEFQLAFANVENKLEEPFLSYQESYQLISFLDNAQIRTHINQGIEKAVKTFKNNTYQVEKSLSSEAPTVVEVTGECRYSDETIFSYIIKMTTTSPEGNTYSSEIYLNYHLPTGQVIELDELISGDTLYEKVSENLSALSEADVISLDIKADSFYFVSPDEIVFVVKPYMISYAQDASVPVSITDISYDLSDKKTIGTAIKHGERVISSEFYEMYFSYPIFEDSTDLYFAINSEITEHLNSLFDYGSSMAIADHMIDADVTPSEDTAPTTETVETSVPETDTNNESSEESEYTLPTYWFNTNYEIYTNNERILSFGLFDYQYTGGAHGLSVGTFYSYDLEAGKLILLEDLFEPKFDYITYINDRIYRKIDAETEADPESPYAYYDFNGITENVKFYIEGNELVIFFDQYEIAAYAAGTPTFRVPLP